MRLWRLVTKTVTGNARRILLSVVFAVLVGSVAACGGTEDGSREGNRSPNGGSPGTEAPAAGEPTAGGTASGATGGTAEIQILGVNDFEGNLEPFENDDGETVGGAAYLAAALDERAEGAPAGTIRVHVGDLVGASPLISSYFHDEPAIEASNLMGFDVATLGNHEFDEGGEEMLRLLNGGRRDDGEEIKGGENTSDPDFPGATYPYVSANVAYKDTGELVLPPYRVVERDGVRVGFIGVTTEAAPQVVAPDAVAPFEFRDISDSVDRYASELREKGVEAIVVLSHEGNENDGVDPPEGNIVEEVRQMSDAVDAVVAGNTEFTIDQEIAGKYVVQAAGKSADYSVADLRVDTETGGVEKATGEVVAFDNGGLRPDPEVETLVGEAQDEISPIAERRVGEAPETISADPNGAGESALGDLVADAQRDAAGADIAFMNPGGIRADVPAGEITYEDLFTVQPFNNQLVRAEMTGGQVRAVLEQQFGLEVPTVLQVSGLAYAYDEGAPEGERVGKVTLDDGGALDRSATYSVAVNSFLLTGGDGFTTLSEATSPETVGGDLDALVEYVEGQEQPISAPEVGNRITRAR